MTLVRMNYRLLARGLALAALAGCGPRETVIRVSIRDPDGRIAPVARLPLVILPYDRDSVLSAMAQRNPVRRPDTRMLDSLFASIRTPFATLTRATDDSRRLQDTLAVLRGRLDTTSRASPEYKALYLSFATAADSLSAVNRLMEDAGRQAAAVIRRTNPRIEPLRRAVTRWEDSTFRSYGSVVDHLSTTLNQKQISVETGADGR
ncbi:MAG TPA: hypothetical protein VMJ30_00710, partial [Gemmatimonadales bacterium]|nr:hypothetical protein [Gemmatimonadales bacterium]